MRRQAAASIGLAAVLAAATGPLAGGSAAAPAGGSAAAAARKGPAHLLVYAQEWSLWPSSTSLPAGAIDVELWNRGEDAHDLRIRRLNAHGAMVGPIDGAVRVTASGAISHAVWHLEAGRYEIYCSMPGHLAMGMHANITIRRAAAG